jgi:hypothetical protein
MIIPLQFGFSQFINFSEKKIFEISVNQSILLALGAMLNIRLERKTATFMNYCHHLASVVCRL